MQQRRALEHRNIGVLRLLRWATFGELLRKIKETELGADVEERKLKIRTPEERRGGLFSCSFYSLAAAEAHVYTNT